MDNETSICFERIKISKLEKIIAVLLVFWPILNIYGLKGDIVGVGDVIILPIALYLFVSRRHEFSKQSYNYFLFFILMVISSAVGVMFNKVGLNRQTILSLIKDFFYIFSFSQVFPRLLNVDFFTSVYKKVVTVLCILLLVQVIIYKLTQKPIVFVLNNPVLYLKDVGGYSTYIATWQHNLQYYGFRPSSIFTEPAKFVQYVSPCLMLSLLDKKKKNFFFEICVTICIFLTTSVNGVAYAAVAWFVWFVSDKSRASIILKFFLILFFLVAILFCIFGDVSDVWLVERIREIGKDGINSGNQRIFRGWIIYGQCSFINQLFGVGVDNAAYYIETTGISTVLDGGYIGYMSGLSQIFVTAGIVGGLFFLCLLLKYFKTKDIRTVSLTILMLLILFASSIINEPTFGLIIAVIEAYFFTKRGEEK